MTNNNFQLSQKIEQQRGKYDNIVIKAIKDGKILIDFDNGYILSDKTNVHNQHRAIGHISTPGNDVLFNFWDNNNTTIREFCVCRAIWLAKNGPIENGKIVSHIDGNKLNNKLSNLYITNPKKYFNKKSWTKDEVEWLSKNRITKTIPELAKYLNRSDKSVRHKIKYLNLETKSKSRQWTEKEDNTILELYKKNKNVEDIAKELGRTVCSVRLRANRKFSIFRDQKFTKSDFKSCKNFYGAMKNSYVRKTLKSKCCICEYDKYIEFHHIDKNRKNNNIDNIASLCPNCHTEVSNNEHENKLLYCIWWRIYKNEIISAIFDNKKEILNKN